MNNFGNRAIKLKSLNANSTASTVFPKVEMETQCNALKLVQDLTAEGHETGWQQTGSLHLARNRERLVHFRKMRAIAQ